MLDRHPLNPARQVERPGYGIRTGRVHALDDGQFFGSKILIPPELLEHAQRELGISILDFRADGIGALGEETYMHVLFHALDTETRAERAAAFFHRQIRVVKNGCAGMPELRRAPAWPWKTVIIASYLRVIFRRAQRHQIEFVLV